METGAVFSSKDLSRSNVRFLSETCNFWLKMEIFMKNRFSELKIEFFSVKGNFSLKNEFFYWKIILSFEKRLFLLENRIFEIKIESFKQKINFSE